ncbi:MAG: ribonuclease III [Verrucomicrobiota bacterium JB022]|nr:ribonuclease III [Verrucomicrobiota bacterium JB022]
MPDNALADFESRIGYHFQDRSLLERALTHPSYIQQNPDEGENNQRLEFLGDAVLSLMLAEKLYAILPRKREGILTRNRAALAKGAHLSILARQIGLPEFLRLSDAEVSNGGRDRNSILEDAFEAVIGAIYLDSDFETARRIVLPWYGDIQSTVEGLLDTHNPKGRLQELLQPHLGNSAIRYEVVGTVGPDHAKQFEARVVVNEEEWGRGLGTSKKAAEEEAARKALPRAEGFGAEGE